MENLEHTHKLHGPIAAQLTSKFPRTHWLWLTYGSSLFICSSKAPNKRKCAKPAAAQPEHKEYDGPLRQLSSTIQYEDPGGIEIEGQVVYDCIILAVYYMIDIFNTAKKSMTARSPRYP
jgi:hypothetical protein